MQLDRLNLNNLRVFQSVFRAQSVTGAAKILHLTQSGVSQHLKSLEDHLGIKLFDRINKKIVPTDAGEKLYQHTQAALFQLEEALLGVTQREREIRGILNIGLPIEFGNNMIIPLLAELGRRYKGLQFNLTMDFASQLNDLLLAGKLDFAFVDEFKLDRRIRVEKIAEEILDLCASQTYLDQAGSPRKGKAYFESLEYIDYQAGEPILRRWFTHHLHRKNLQLKVRAHVMDVQAVARFVKNHLGVGILPDHLLTKLFEQGHDIYVFKGSGRPLKNHISLAYLKQRSHSPAANLVMQELKQSLLQAELKTT